MPELIKELTKMPNSGHHALWAELKGDSALRSLRLVTLGWVREKRERVAGKLGMHAICILRSGEGSFWDEASATLQRVCAPGLFFNVPGVFHDYGAAAGDAWEEFYWIVDGARVAEWKASAWWPDTVSFETLEDRELAEWEQLFGATVEALSNRSTVAIDRAKISLEALLAVRAAKSFPSPPAMDPLGEVTIRWRQEPWRGWDLPGEAARVGMSYSAFRALFVKKTGLPPYQYLLTLRLELASRWLRATREPVKSIALRCGFNSSEAFIRAFTRKYRRSPSQWRAACSDVADCHDARTGVGVA